MGYKNIKCGIYKIENQVNKKIYIGSSNNISKRWSTHKTQLKNNKHDNQHLQSAWNKYGKSNFVFSIIELVNNIELLNEREQYWIDYLKVGDDDIGYNIAPYANCVRGITYSKEQILQMRKTLPILQFDLEGNLINRWYGAREAGNELNLDQSCIWHCCHKNRKTYKNFIWVFEDEYIQNGLNLLDYISKTPALPIVQLDLNGNFIKEWANINIASKSLKIDHRCISRCCKKEQSYYTAGGFKWMYKDEYLNGVGITYQRKVVLN